MLRLLLPPGARAVISRAALLQPAGKAAGPSPPALRHTVHLTTVDSQRVSIAHLAPAGPGAYPAAEQELTLELRASATLAVSVCMPEAAGGLAVPLERLARVELSGYMAPEGASSKQPAVLPAGQTGDVLLCSL